MLLIGYLVCYFIALMFLKIVFDWTKEDIGKIFKHGLIFLFLSLVFIGALVYDFVDKRWDKRHLEVSQKKVYYGSIDFLYEMG